MQGGQIPRGQPVRGEVLEVEGHDYVRATLDRRREDMPIVWIGEGQRRDQRFEAGDEAILHASVHERTEGVPFRPGDV